MELKEIDPKVKSFTANGKEYFVESKLSIERFIAYQKLEVEFAFNGGFASIMKMLDQSFEHLNKGELASACVLVDNTRKSIRKQDKDKRIPAIDLCSLFLNTKDEDRRVITDEMLLEKQRDFEEEGIPIDFFLHLAANLVTGYKEYLKPKESTISKVEENQNP